MNDKYLPIGSVVKLKGGEKKVMITSYLIFSAGNKGSQNIYDYGGCTYPEGILDSKVGVGFNHAQIEEIYHVGYKDEDQKEMNKLLLENAEKVKEEYKKSKEKTKSE